MFDSLRRFLSSPALAWLLAVILLAVVVVREIAPLGIWSGSTSLRSPVIDYVSAMEKLAGADRSQAPRLKLEGQFPGPLQDTTIERWRDPVDGTVCYVYLPIAVAHAAGPAGLVQYGSAAIGTISCFPTQSQRAH